MSAGKRVASGTLRVDARKAVEKLRSYRNEDPTTWVLDAIRACISISAAQIAVDADADDVFVQASLEPPPLEDLEDLLSELVSPEASSERRGLRLLGSAINSALAIGPALVDVVHVAEDGEETIVRYTVDPEAEPLRAAPAPRDARPPRPLSGPGLRIHVRRPLSLAVFGRFLVGRRLPEIDHVRNAALGLAIPLTVDGQPIVPKDSSLLRVPLGSGLDGHIALIAPDEAEAEPMLEARELGVRLATMPANLPDLSAPRARVPIRVVFDSPKLPTDVSRSRVRIAPPVSDVLERANERLGELVTVLERKLATEPTPALRDAALELLACRVAGSTFVADAFHLPASLAPLARLPLVHDATGKLRALVDLSRDTVAVHQDDEPVDPTLRAWFGQMLWARPGSPERRLLGDATFPSSYEVMQRAITMMRAARTFRSRPIEKDVVERDDALVKVRLGERVELPFELPATPIDGLRGELAIGEPRAERDELRIHLLHESRAFADLAFPSILPFAVTVDSAVIEPDETYTGVKAGDPGLARTLRLVRREALRATLALLGALAGEDESALGATALPALSRIATADERARLARRAIRQLALSLVHPDAGQHPPSAVLDEGCVAAHLEAYPLVRQGTDDRLVSLAALVHLASDGVVVLGPDAELPPGGGHVCVRLGDPDREFLSSLLPEGTPVVTYPAALARPGFLATPLVALRARASLDSPFSLSFEDGELRGVIARTRAAGRVLRRHRGVDVDETEYPGLLLPCRIVLEDDGLVPRPVGPALEPRTPRSWAELEYRLLDAVLGAIEREDSAPESPPGVRPTAASELASPSGLAPSVAALRDDVVALLLALATTPEGRYRLPQELRDRALKARVFARVGAPPISIEELRTLSSGAPHPYVTSDFDPARLDDPSFRPLLASTAIAETLTASYGVALEAADASLDARFAAADRRRRIELHRAGPVRASAAPADATSLPIAAGYARFWPDARGIGLSIRVDVEGRAFAAHRDPEGLPLEGEVDLGLEVADEAFKGLSADAGARLAKLARKAAARILVEAVADDPTRLVGDERLLSLAAAYARAPGPKDARETREALEALRRAPFLRTAQGGTVALSSLAPKRAVLVATADPPEPPLAVEEETAPIDREVVCLGTGARAEHLRALLDALAHGGTRDVGRVLETVLAARSIARGEVAAPTLPDADREESRSLDSLGIDLARIAVLGHGTIALADPGKGEVRVFDARGERVATLPLPEGPPVRVATLSAPLAARATAGGSWPESERSRLDSALREAARALLRALSESPTPFGEKAIERIAHAVLDHRLVDVSLFRHVPLVIDAGGRRARVDVLAERHPDGIPYVPKEKAELARVAAPETLVLPRAWLETLRSSTRLRDVSGELELASSRTAFEARRPLEEIAVEPAIRDVALAVVPLRTGSRRGELAPLEPAERKHRGLAIVHRGRLLCRLPDPCELPTFAIVEDPAIIPDPGFRGVERNEALDALLHEVREKSRKAIEALHPPPPDALAPLVLGPDVALANTPSEAIVRGELHLSRDLERCHVIVITTRRAEAHSIEIVHRGRPGARNLPVPIEGTLLVASKKGTPNVRPLLLSAYGRLAEGAMDRIESDPTTPDRDLLLAHVLHARALSLVSGRPALDAIELPVNAGGTRTLGSLVRSLEAFERLPFVAVENRGAVPGDVLVDDGGPIVKVLLAHLGDRARRVGPGFEHRRSEPAEPSPEPFALVPPPSAGDPKPATAKPEKKRKKAAKEPGARPKASTRAEPKAAPPHPSETVVEALDPLIRRIRVPGFVVKRVVLVRDVDEPSVRYDVRRRELLVAAENDRVRELASALARGDAQAPTALRALALRSVAAVATEIPDLGSEAFDTALAALLDA